MIHYVISPPSIDAVRKVYSITIIGDGEHRWRSLDAERAPSLQIDDELEFGYLPLFKGWIATVKSIPLWSRRAGQRSSLFSRP
jgi:hypothetical protein